MNTAKLTLIFASFALVLALATGAYAAATTNSGSANGTVWCGGQYGSNGAYGNGSGCGSYR